MAPPSQPSDPNSVRATIRAFITQSLMRQPDYPLRDDEPIISSRLIDSFGVAELGVFFEREFGVFVPDTELNAKAMDTLDLITDRVLRGMV